MGLFEMKSFIIVLLASLMISGCATLQNLTPKQEKTLSLVVTKCPILTKYTPAQLQKAADELESLPTESQIAKMVVDYSKIRAACRAVEKKLQATK